MPYGGKNQLTEVQTMVAKVPVAKGNTDAVTMMSYGFNPYLSSWSPYHGAVYAVTESIAKITAAGGDYSKIRMTFQEYFRRMTEDSHTWGLPFASLLGAYAAQMGFGLPSIGGKDSMSGSFDELNVPPTLVSFAVDVASENDVVTPEFKKAGNKLVLFAIEKDEYDLPNYEQVKKLYGQIHEAVRNGQIVSSYAIGAGGIAEAVSKMAFGNGLGAVINAQLDKNLLFAPLYGNILAEVPAECIADLEVPCEVIGEVSAEPTFTYGEIVISMDEAVKSWKSTLEKVFPSVSGKTQPKVDTGIYKADSIYVCKNKVAKPKVFIPVFPGTNCEYDSAKGDHALSAGDLFFTFSSKPFYIQNSEKLEYIYISFIGLRAPALFDRLGIDYSAPVYNDFDFLRERWTEAFDSANSANIDLVCEGLLLHTLSFLCKNSREMVVNHKSTGILKLKAYVDMNYTQTELNLKTVSQRFNYSYKYTSNAFIKLTRIPFSNYLCNLRLSHARQLLEDGISNIQEVACSSGFSDAQYFSKAFKKKYGTTPSEYRKAFK